jgi:hypothetical protein
VSRQDAVVIDVIVPARFCGPPDSANGGYTAGLLARHLGGTAEVTLRQPPPLDTPMVVARDGDRLLLKHGDDPVAEAVTATVGLDAPEPVGWDEAVAASASSLFLDPDARPFPTCFACGPRRADGDGLRIFAGRIARPDTFASTWVPPEDVREEIVWAALDCPGSAPAFYDETVTGPFVLGRIAARVERLPAAGERHVVMSWGLGRDGRKVGAGSAIFSPTGELCAIARATWIQLLAGTAG